jgi:hypothetical protein
LNTFNPLSILFIQHVMQRNLIDDQQVLAVAFHGVDRPALEGDQ